MGAEGASYFSSACTGRPWAIAPFTTLAIVSARPGAPRTDARPSASSTSPGAASSSAAAAASRWWRTSRAALSTALPDISSWRVAVVVPARGVKWLSRPTATTCATSRPSTSAVIAQSDEVWPPPTSGAAQRTTAVPSSSMPTQALAESRVQHMRPYGVNEAATARPIRVGRRGVRRSPSPAHARLIVSESRGSVSST